MTPRSRYYFPLSRLFKIRSQFLGAVSRNYNSGRSLGVLAAVEVKFEMVRVWESRVNATVLVELGVSGSSVLLLNKY